MIVPMKNVTVLCLEADRDAALERLRELGVVHLTPVRPVESDDIEERRKEWDYLRRALEVLPAKASAPRCRKSEKVLYCGRISGRTPPAPNIAR